MLEKLEWKEFKKTGVEAVDGWLEKVAGVVNTVKELGEACDLANEGILELYEVKEMIDENVEEKNVKNVLKYMVKTSKEKDFEIKVKCDDEGIEIEISAEGYGAGWKFFDAVVKLCIALSKFIKESPELVEKIEEFVKESQELPDKLKEALEGQTLQLAAATPKLLHNTKNLAAIPNVLKEAIENARKLTLTLKDIFEGKEPEG